MLDLIVRERQRCPMDARGRHRHPRTDRIAGDRAEARGCRRTQVDRRARACSWRRPSSMRISTWMRRCRFGLPRLNALGHAARRHRALGRAEAAADAGGDGRARAALLRLGGGARGCSRSARMSTSATTGCWRSRRCWRCAKRVAPYLDLQLVAFPQDGCCARRRRADNLKRALDMGVDVVGGIPHFERTMADGAASVTRAVRDRGRARPARRHALRRDRRPAVAPCRDAGLRDPAPRPAGPRRPARTSPRCIRWTTTTSPS